MNFIIHFEAVADAEKWSDQHKGRILLKSLDGSATSVLGSIPAELRSNYKTLKEALNQRYNPRLDSDLSGIIAQSRKRKSSESYLDFSLELKKLVRESYPSWTSDVIESIAREKFFAAIEDPLMRGTLWARQPKSVYEAAIMADALETISDQTSAEQMAMYNSGQKGGNQRGRYHNAHGPIICYLCQQQGHIQRNCPMNVPSIMRDSSQGSNSNRDIVIQEN